MKIVLACFMFALLCPGPAASQPMEPLEFSAPPGPNYDKADFRFWSPDGPVRGVVVLLTGSNGDGRPMADEPFWREFATKERLAVVACRFTDKPHEQGFIEEYVDASKGSGQALLDALEAFATRSGHPEIAAAPLFLWGMSAGGQFNYEFAAWKPERVAAFVVNKGGIYYSALLPRAARAVPALLFVGDQDLAFRTNTIVGLFAVNRRAGALWALVTEPGTAHAVGRSRDLGAMFFADVLALRMSSESMTPLDAWKGFIGDLAAGTIRPAAGAPAPSAPSAWLPTERIARAWQAVITGKPFEK